MRRYFFHIREGGSLVRDEEGIQLVDDASARAEALRGARSLLSAAVCEGRLPLDHAIVVADEAGAVLFELSYREAVE